MDEEAVHDEVGKVDEEAVHDEVAEADEVVPTPSSSSKAVPIVVKQPMWRNEASTKSVAPSYPSKRRVESPARAKDEDAQSWGDWVGRRQ